MKVKRFLSMLLCAALVFSLLPVTAQAAESELVVTHTAEGDLAAEITAALGGNLAEGYTKIKINIGDAALSGGYNSGDWKTLCDLTGTLPDVSVLELVYTAGDRAIPYKAMYETSWLNKLMLTNEGGTLTGIEECAFYGTGLTGTLTIPPSVTSIGNAAFYGCAGIAGLSLPAMGSLNIGNYAFWGTGLTGTLTIPPSVTSIGYAAFSTVSGITGLSLPEAGKLSIGSYAFSETGLTGTLTIPPSVSSIGNAAFYGCAEITGLSLPATGSLSIGESAFWGTGLTGTLTIPPSVTSIGYAAFSTVSGITGLSLPEAGKLSIGSYAFSETGLTGTLTIPPSVTSIGNATFIRCPEITSLSLPEAGSLSMGMEAFRHTGLTGTLTIPSSVTSIGRYAFNGCKGLEALVFRNAEAAPTMMPVITDQLLTAYYPAAAEAAYTAQSGLPANRASYNDATARLTHFHTGGVRGVIGEAAKTVTLDLPAATELTSLTPDIGFIGASVSPASGAAQDFSAGSRTYTVTPVSGSPVVYTVSIFLSPTVSGSNNLSGTVGGMGNIDVDADVSDSFPGMDIALTASIDTLTATASRTGDGTATFTFAAADLNTLAPGSYDILVSAAATAYNAAIASTNVGTLTVMVPSADAALSNLSISQGTLKPTFATGTYAYTASVAHGVSSVTVTPTARDTNATIKVNGMDVTSGSASGPISLNVGKNDITVGVIAQNTTVNQNYTITVTRTGSSGGGGGWSYTDATLSPAKVDFDKNGGKDITVTLKKGRYGANKPVNRKNLWSICPYHV